MNNRARTIIVGTTFYSPSETHSGLTLISPLCSKEIFLINLLGDIIHKWKIPYRPASYPELLPNGNILYVAKIDNGPLSNFEGAGGKIIEMDKNNKIVWEYDDPYLHHACYRLENSNTLVIKWVKVPQSIAEKVKGGLLAKGENCIMWGDAVQEISSSGEIIWEWQAHDYLDSEGDSICPICSRLEWTHITSIDILENSNILLNCMRTNNIIVINKKTKIIEKRWGKQELSHPNEASVLKNGNFLIFDTGRHCGGEGVGFSRALELDPNTNKMVWSYEEDPPVFLYSCFLGNCQRLPNNNTLICEGTTGRILEVNQRGHMVWEYVIPGHYSSNIWGKNRYVFGAKRYGLDYVGLRNFYGLKKNWITWDERGNSDVGQPERKPEQSTQSDEDLIRSRLEPLGY